MTAIRRLSQARDEQPMRLIGVKIDDAIQNGLRAIMEAEDRDMSSTVRTLLREAMAARRRNAFDECSESAP